MRKYETSEIMAIAFWTISILTGLSLIVIRDMHYILYTLICCTYFNLAGWMVYLSYKISKVGKVDI